MNSPELNGKYLGTITEDFVKIVDVLKEASYQIRTRKISQYPIFVFCKEKPAIGQEIIDKNDQGLKWNVNFSMMEEFLQRGLVAEEHQEEFAQSYRDPEEFACIFVVDQEFTNFVSVPYPDSEQNSVLGV